LSFISLLRLIAGPFLRRHHLFLKELLGLLDPLGVVLVDGFHVDEHAQVGTEQFGGLLLAHLGVQAGDLLGE
jgi:hypothetical protein